MRNRYFPVLKKYGTNYSFIYKKGTAHVYNIKGTIGNYAL